MFRQRLSQHADRVEACLKAMFNEVGQGQLADAMRYATLSGGKRLRAFLVLEGADLYGVRPQQSDRVAAAAECIHAYSLVHDDLPAMDDDDLRRGQPTVHRKWDEATAILAGDALQTMAFDILASVRTTSDAGIRLRLISSLAAAVGSHGMVLGQAQDIAAETASARAELATPNPIATDIRDRNNNLGIQFSSGSGKPQWLHPYHFYYSHNEPTLP